MLLKIVQLEAVILSLWEIVAQVKMSMNVLRCKWLLYMHVWEFCLKQLLDFLCICISMKRMEAKRRHWIISYIICFMMNRIRRWQALCLEKHWWRICYCGETVTARLFEMVRVRLLLYIRLCQIEWQWIEIAKDSFIISIRRQMMMHQQWKAQQ